MILKLFKNLMLALLLDAGAALAFHGDQVRTARLPTQSCALPLPGSDDNIRVPETMEVPP